MSRYHITVGGQPKCDAQDEHTGHVLPSPCSHSDRELLESNAATIRALWPGIVVEVVEGECPMADGGAW